MTFRDDGDAQRRRIDALEDQLAEARAENEKLREQQADVAAETSSPDGWPTYAANDAVWIEWRGRWWRGRVIALERLAMRVHYDGWSDAWDETVGHERLRPIAVRPPGPVAGTWPWLLVGLALLLVLALVYAVIRTPARSYDAHPPIDAAHLAIGAAVSIEWNGTWYPGTIVSVEGDGTYGVHYDGWSESSDERVSTDRLSPR